MVSRFPYLEFVYTLTHRDSLVVSGFGLSGLPRLVTEFAGFRRSILSGHGALEGTAWFQGALVAGVMIMTYDA